jgi:hypothetical protein
MLFSGDQIMLCLMFGFLIKQWQLFRSDFKTPSNPPPAGKSANIHGGFPRGLKYAPVGMGGGLRFQSAGRLLSTLTYKYHLRSPAR